MRGIEPQSSHYSHMEGVSPREHTSFSAETEAAVQSMLSGPSIPTGSLDTRTASLSRYAFSGVTATDVRELMGQGKSDAQMKKELSARYASPAEQAAFKKGWARAQASNRKSMEDYLGGMSLEEETAFVDAWTAIAAVY